MTACVISVLLWLGENSEHVQVLKETFVCSGGPELPCAYDGGTVWEGCALCSVLGTLRLTRHPAR